MAETLTGHEVLVTQLPDEFTLHVMYENNPDVDYVNAVINAMRGRLGERLNHFSDDPDNCILCFGVSYDTTEYPDVFGDFDEIERKDVGRKYSGNGHIVKALRVHRDMAGTLREFVGNGRMIVQSKMSGGKARFEFVTDGRFVDAFEGSWIVEENGRFFCCNELWFKEHYKALNTVFYMSLPITGYDIGERKETCRKCRERLLANFPTCSVIVPFDVEPAVAAMCNGPQYGDYMAECVRLLLNEADCVMFLGNPRASQSKGVRLEYELARIYGKDYELWPYADIQNR